VIDHLTKPPTLKGATIQNPIQFLRDIEQQNQQGGTKVSKQAAHTDSWSAIDFKMAQVNYLVPIKEVLEVLLVPSQITVVPKSKAWVYGMYNLRGELLPIFDLKCFFFGQTSNTNSRSRILVINHLSLYFGLLIDEVFCLKHFQEQPKQNLQQEGSLISSYLSGSIGQKEVYWDVFSLQKLTSDPRFLNAAK
jgi:twitching motility protein PilI|tara:strand:- start:14 stop:589 length:576 start_codon:yes stop_codon:yes gene_type:complete